VTKRLDRLRLVIFENGESAPVEIGDHTLLLVKHGGMQDDFFYLSFENEGAALVLGLLPLLPLLFLPRSSSLLF